MMAQTKLAALKAKFASRLGRGIKTAQHKTNKDQKKVRAETTRNRMGKNQEKVGARTGVGALTRATAKQVFVVGACGL